MHCQVRHFLWVKEAALATSVQSVSRSKEFRKDINGLRAWAVIAVVLYHFGVPGAQGGFVGVDVFFVISGFLMSGIILDGLGSRKFSVWRFYWARARRIVPALAVLCVAVLLIGWFMLMTSDYQVLGLHVRDSLLFSSNLQYLNESGYFESDAHEKWLLHTWSLSVEWQFYLLFPLFLIAVAKLFGSPRSLILSILTLLLVSFVWSVFLTANQPAAAFFKLESRAWEMLAGAMVFVCGRAPVSNLAKQIASWLGLGMIMASVVYFTPESQWPGWAALLPVCGAALVLLAHNERSAWTGCKLSQWLGERSYSIYLWHWPLVVVSTYYGIGSHPLWALSGIALSIFLGHLSYLFVEETTRHWLSRQNSELRGFLWLFAVCLAVLLAAQYVRKTGAVERLPDGIREVDLARLDVNPKRDMCQDVRASCVYGGESVELIVVGDSHADMLVTAVADSLDEPGGVLYKGESGCLVMAGARKIKKHPDCEDLNSWVLQELPEILPGKPVLLINALSGYALGSGDSYDNVGRPSVYLKEKHQLSSIEFRDEFRKGYIETVCSISDKHPLYVMRPLPEMPAPVPSFIGRAMLHGWPTEIYQSIEDYRKRNDFIWSVQDEAADECGITILDPLPYLCAEDRCMGAENGVLYYSDTDHLTQSGNRRLIPLFQHAFRQGQ